jgi:hypothetical protein
VRLQLPSDQLTRLQRALTEAGTKEIGGQIFGEQLAPSDFRASELTFQKRPGTIARFVVDLIQAARDAVRFFDRTEHRYTRFNYIGEWHSHPSFEVRPSGTDVATMRSIVNDGAFRGNFAVLMIVRLHPDRLQLGGWVFDPKGGQRVVALEAEP